MFNYIWPVALVVLSNTFYQICAKELPAKMDPFASLTVTYLAAALVSCLCYFIFNKNGNLIQQYSYMNWAPLVLGLSIVGLEAGMIYAYRAGWQVSVLTTFQAAVLAGVLVFVGWLLYHEAISWTKLAGLAICLAGLWLLNK